MKQNTKTNRTRWMLAAAVAGAMMSLAGSASFAQYRVGDDGRARDASNRIGSGGYNVGGIGSTSPYAVNGNNIVTGNVTGGREFRGFVPYTDPGAFRGRVSGSGVDRFVSGSAGVPTGAFNNNNAQNVTQFYGDSRATPPPTGFVQQTPGGTGYVPGPPQTRGAGDIRMGNPFDTLQVQQPSRGQLVMPGPVDPQSQSQTVITASPLYGVRQWRFGDAASEQFLQDYTDVYANSRRGSLLDSATLNQMRTELGTDATGQNNGTLATQNGDLNADRSINSQAGATALDNGFRTGGDGTGASGEPNRGGAMGGERGNAQPGENGSQQDPGGINRGISNQPLSSDFRGRDIGFTQRGTAPTASAARASRQYQALQDRLQQYQQNRGATANNERVRANAQRDPNNPNANANPNAMNPGAIKPGSTAGMPQPGATGAQPGMPQPGGATPGMPMPGSDPNANPNDPGTGTPGTGTPGTGMPSAGAPGGAPSGTGPGAGTGTGDTGAAGTSTPALPGVAPAVPQPSNTGTTQRPLQITSFSKDMKDSQVTGLMKEAEDLMKQGKYTTALERYDVVDQVTPNDPLVMLGRATAELGASYYTRANTHLRQAFTQDSALLMGQYDLRAFLGDERLRILVADLKDLATKNKNDVQPVFLLAYIAYNTGNERNAAAYIDLAEKRAGGKDPFFKVLRDHWSLPADAAPIEGDMNK